MLVPAPEGADAAPIPARLIIRRKPAAAAARAQAKAVRKAARQGYAAQPRQIEAAAHFMVMTTLPHDTMPADAVCALYRLRWQIELAFKRLKSLMGLEEIDARERAPGQGRGLRQADPGHPRREPARPRAGPFPHPLTGRLPCGAWPACSTSG